MSTLRTAVLAVSLLCLAGMQQASSLTVAANYGKVAYAACQLAWHALPRSVKIGTHVVALAGTAYAVYSWCTKKPTASKQEIALENMCAGLMVYTVHQSRLMQEIERENAVLSAAIGCSNTLRVLRVMHESRSSNRYPFLMNQSVHKKVL